jgi:endonuclease/exonuclease/phosphatase family metal-dependent hydrolase
MPVKVTSWNIEHASRLLPSGNPSTTVLDRRRRIRETLDEIDPDILCIVEAPRGEQGLTDFCREVFDDRWLPVLLRGADDALGDRDRDYKIKGAQWIGFVVKPELLPRCRLQAPETWQAFTGSTRWEVHYWGRIESEEHRHYRHPQVLLVELEGGDELELIGLHLKSKINRNPITRDGEGNLTGDYLEEALKARVKLATEAHDVRQYVDVRFRQNVSPAILLMGDCNDGPGQDCFEDRYLFFDLIQNLQGEILAAEKFFNHCLFDFPAELRFSARYRDEVLGVPASQNPLLLDHILISQPLVRGELSLEVRGGAGKVEHEAFERANVGASSRSRTSDHRPVSCLLEETHGNGG